MNLEAYRCWLIVVDVMKDAPWPAAVRAAAEGAPARRRVVYCDAEGAPRGAAQFPALDAEHLPGDGACDALLFRPMGLIDERVYCAIARVPAARAAALFARDGLTVLGPRLGELQREVLGLLRDEGRYPDDRSVFGGLAARPGPLPTILYFEPLSAAAVEPAGVRAGAGGGRDTGVAVDAIVNDAPFPFDGVVLFGRRPSSSGDRDIELPLLVFYLLNEIAIYHWCRYCIELLKSSDLASLAGGEPRPAAAATAAWPSAAEEERSEAAYRAFFAAVREYRARISALRHELPRLRAEVASCRRFFAQLAAQPPPPASPPPSAAEVGASEQSAGPPPPSSTAPQHGPVPRAPNFNVELIDGQLQEMATLINTMAEQAALLHEEARLNHQAAVLGRQSRLQRRQLALTYALLALVVVALLDGPAGRAVLGFAFALVQKAAAVAVFDPLLERLLAGLLPGR